MNPIMTGLIEMREKMALINILNWCVGALFIGSTIVILILLAMVLIESWRG